MPEFSSPTQAPAFRLALPCDFAEVRKNADLVRAFLIRQGCNPNDVADCDLVLVEACNNAIENTVAAARTEPVLIEALCRPDEIELRITDHTPGFDLTPSQGLPAAESEAGRGLFLIQKLMQQ